MQTDMHYYGTFAMARASGLIQEVAQVIAIAAEYVDDSDAVGLELQDGIVLGASPTAHHPLNKANLDIVDQRGTWVPFHFLPGNEGDTTHERLICRKDSKVAREMVDHHVALPLEGYNLELLGITAHAYADTFSHYGFSGIGSPLNQVDPSTIKLHVKDTAVLEYITNKSKDFFEKYVFSVPANIAALGHGAVATFPDRPYLTWEFTYASSKKGSGARVNQATFLEACEKLHAMFIEFGERNTRFVESGARRTFIAINATVKEVLAVEGDMAARIAAWQRVASSGALFGKPVQIPAYSKTFAADIEIMKAHTMASVKSTSAYAFLKAAAVHRDYVVDELLPKYQLNVLSSI